jgi:transposase
LQYFRDELKPSEFQKTVLNHWIGAGRSLYDIALEQRAMIDYREMKARFLGANPVSKTSRKGVKTYRSIDYDYQYAELIKLKKEFPWFGGVPRQTLQQTLKSVDIAFKRFFAKVASFPIRKKKIESLRPSFLAKNAVARPMRILMPQTI